MSGFERKWKNQRGNAGLLAIIVLGFAALTVLGVMTANSMRESRNLDKSRSKLHEKWQARSGMNILANVVAKDVPAQMNSDVQWAKSNCGVNVSLPIFDPDNLQGTSSPAVTFSNANLTCSNAPSPTSIFGRFSQWSEKRKAVFEATGVSRFALDSNNIKIIQLDEIYRRTLNDSDTAYAVRYIVESKFGNYRTRTNGELILGSNLPACGTSAELEVAPATIERGQSVDMNISYAYANRLEIYNSSNVLINTQIVAEQTTRQTYTYRFSPNSTDTYRVVASGSGGCQARSANVLITVNDPPITCASINSFSSSSILVNSGENFTLSWNVTDATNVTLDGVAVAAVSNLVTSINANRGYTLVAQKTGCGDVTQVVNVQVRPPAPCTYSNPTINNFSASATSITPGASTNLSWSVSGLEASNEVTITGNGVNQTVGSSGTLTVTPPAADGNYTYTITTSNICADSSRRTSTATVTIQVRTCPLPVIDAFTLSPNSASAGIGTVRFAWSISGTADSVSISNGIGGGLPASGFVDINTPNVGGNYNYTLSTVGCGQTRTQTVTLTVTSCNPPSINFFTANPAVVTQGGNQTVRLQWDAAADCGGTASIDNGVGNVPLSGGIDIAQPQVTTNYTITVNSPGGTVTRIVTVVVQPPTNFCGQLPAWGAPDTAQILLGGVGFGPSPPSDWQQSRAEYRLAVTHNSDNTYRFNIEWHLTGDMTTDSDIIIYGYSGNAPITIGNLRLFFYNRVVEVRDASNNVINTFSYDYVSINPNESVYVLSGATYTDPGKILPGASFNFATDQVRVNDIVMAAKEYEYSNPFNQNGPFNVSVGNGVSNFGCP